MIAPTCLLAFAARAGAEDAAPAADDPPAADEVLQQAQNVLRARIAKAVVGGAQVNALVKFGNEKTRARLLKVDGEKISIRIPKFNDLEAAAEWACIEGGDLAAAARPAIDPKDAEGLMALLAVLRIAERPEAGDVLAMLKAIGDEKRTKEAADLFARFAPEPPSRATEKQPPGPADNPKTPPDPSRPPKAKTYGEIITAGPTDIQGGFDTLNAVRALYGIDPLKRDAAIEAGQLKHLAYFRAGGPYAHEENPKHPAFSAEGNKAGTTGWLARGATGKEVVLGLLDTFHHRVIMLRPDVDTVGIAYDGKMRTVMYDPFTAPRSKVARIPEMVAYPPDGATEVRPGWSGVKSPPVIPGTPPAGGVGQTVTLTFPRSLKFTEGTITLADQSGKAVDAWTSSPLDPVSKDMFGDNLGTLCLIPKAPLRVSTTYIVKAEAVVGGKKVSKTWQFTTAKTGRYVGK
jgi:uncharacterized protein YkwD